METEKQILNQQKRQNLVLSNPNLYKSIFILALPIFLSNFMKAMNDIVDLFFVSNLLPTELVDAGVTATTLPASIFNIASAAAIGIMTAGAAMMAQYLGAKRKDNAQKVAGQLLVLCILVGLIMNILVFLLAPSIMNLMGVEGAAYDYMLDYVRIRSFEMVPLFAFFAFQASRTASGDTITPFILNIIMIFTNVILTYVFMKFGNMGVSGAAYGTLIGNAIIVPVFIYMMFHGGSRNISIRLKDMNFDRELIMRLFRMSWPAALAQAFTSLGFLILNGIILSYGESTVAAFSVGNKINSMILMPAMGIGSITATFVGQNIGARNQERAKKSIRTAMTMALVFSIVGGGIMLIIREDVARIFLKEGSETFNLSVDYLFFVLIGLPLMSIFQVFMGTYQGSGETKYSLIIAGFRLWLVRIPLVLIFKNLIKLDESSIWYAMTISNYLSAYVGCILYTKCKFLPRIKIDDEENIDGSLAIA